MIIQQLPLLYIIQIVHCTEDHLTQSAMNYLLYYTQLTKTTSILTQLDALYGQFQADTSFLRTKLYSILTKILH
jgi:hypothetical protein